MSRPMSAEVEQIITLVRVCQQLYTLPLPGGLFDQDSYFVYLTKIVLEADAQKALNDRNKT